MTLHKVLSSIGIVAVAFASVVSAISVNQVSTTYLCGGGTLGDTLNDVFNLYIPPGSDNNGDGTPDISRDWVCNAQASDAVAGGISYGGYNVYDFSTSFVQYFFQDINSLYSPITNTASFGSADFDERSSISFSPLSNPVGYDPFQRIVESQVNPGGNYSILFQEPSNVSLRESVISCHLNFTRYVDFPGGSAISVPNTLDVLAPDTTLDLPFVGPFSNNDVTENGPGSLESCEHHVVHWCGDGVLDTGLFDNTSASEQCDPATEAGGTPVFGPGFSAATHSCNDQCQAIPVGAPSCTISATPNPITAGGSTTVTWTTNGGTSWVYEVGFPGGVQQSVTPNGSRVEAPTQNTTYAITVTGPGGSTTCTTDVVVNPSSTVLKEQSTDNLNWNTFAPGAPMIVSVGDTIYYRITVSNPTQVAIQNLRISDNDLVDEPGLSCNYAGFTSFGFSPIYNGSLTNPEWSVGVFPAGSVGTLTFSCTVVAASFGTLSPGEFVNFATIYGNNIATQVTNSVASTIADIFVQKYQSTGRNPTNILDYGITNVATPVSPLLIQPTDRIYYRIAAQNLGGSVTNVVIGDQIPGGLVNCSVETTSSTNAGATITPSGLWGNPAFTVNIFDPNDIVQIVISCDVGNAVLAPFNNQATVTVPGVIPTPINSNIVSSSIVDIALQKYQATGWNSASDPFGTTITNIQGDLAPGAMNVAGVNRIYYRLEVENLGGTLSGLQVLDTLNPALQNCQIEAAWRDTTNAISLVSIMGSVLEMQFPVTSTFQGGELVTIIYSCEIPAQPISNQFTNDFTATINWGFNNQSTTGSNMVVAEIPDISLEKWQRNDTSGQPGSGGLLLSGLHYTTGAVLYNTGDVFSFVLLYGNNSSDVLNNVTVVDTFPAGFVITSAMPAGGALSCNGGPFVPGFSYSTCTWNIGQLLQGQTGMMVITGTMDQGTPGFYFNTGQIYDNGLLFDTSVVQQIPNLILGGPDLSIEKRQVSAVNSGFTVGCDPISCTHTTNPISVQNNYWISYQMTITNNGSGVATGVQMYDFFPMGFIPQGTPTIAGTVPGFCDPYSGPTASGHFSVSCYPSTALPPGGSITFTINGYVVTNATSIGGSGNIMSYLNTANVISTNDPDCAIIGDCTSTVIATVPGTPVLDIEKDFLVTTAEPGDVVQFILRYRNIGSAGSLATGLTIQDLWPAGMSYISHQPTTIAYNPATATFDLSGQHPGGLGVTASRGGFITVTAQIATGFAGTSMVNTGIFCATNAPGCVDDDDTLAILVTTGIDIVKTATISGSQITGAQVGDTITYVIDFINNGNTSLDTYQITDFLPPTVTYINGSSQASLQGGAFANANPNQTPTGLVWTCTNGVSASLPNPCTLGAGGTGQIIFDVIVN